MLISAVNVGQNFKNTIIKEAVMQKSKLGITVGALGAITYFAAFFGGYIPLLLLAAYVLMAEENPWLKRCVVKAVVITVFFSLLIAIIGFIPDFTGITNKILTVINISPSIVKVDQIVAVITSAISIIEKALFIMLGYKALNQGTVVIPFIDSRVSKIMD